MLERDLQSPSIASHQPFITTLRCLPSPVLGAGRPTQAVLTYAQTTSECGYRALASGSTTQTPRPESQR